MKTAIMFSGQGSQYPLMGIDVINLKHNEDKVKRAENILGFNIKKALKNENNELSNTKYTQPLMVLVSILLFDEYKIQNQVHGLVGFSLGEYSALYSSGLYSFDDVIRLVKYRSELMEEACKLYPGKMIAVLNADLKLLEDLVSSINNEDDIVSVANYNSRKQIVLSGNNSGIDKIIDQLRANNIKRIVPLNVSGAFHSILMKDASISLNKYLNSLVKLNIEYPIYLNTTSKPLKIDKLEVEMTKQMYSPVLFYQAIENMINDGYTKFIEIGPGKVLRNIVYKNYPDVLVESIEKLDDLNKLEVF